MLGLAAFPTSAAALSCPAVIGPDNNNRQYTADAATACVYGDGNIGQGNPLNDEFMSNGSTGGNLGGGWTSLAVLGNTASYLSFTGTTNGTWTVTVDPAGALPGYGEFALGIDDGGFPKYAVFLLDMTPLNVVTGTLSGTWSILGGNGQLINVSHMSLYARSVVPDDATPDSGNLPEPTSLLLLGTGLGLAAYRVRRKTARATA